MKNNYIKLVHSNSEHNDWFVVNWCLGNTCNYSCSYCPSGLHDSSKNWPDPETIKKFILLVKTHHHNKKIYFEFTGGEVSMYKHFAEICQFCSENDVKVGFISNGSRTLRWWQENKQYFDHVCLSFHPEQGNELHFLEVVKILADSVRTHVNIMMMPEKFDYCYSVAEKIITIPNISLALQPLIVDFGDTLYEYTADQHTILNKQHELLTRHIKHTKRFPYYRGAMRKIYENNQTEVISAHRFINDKSNNWNGWKCYAGVEQLIVDMDGSIYRGWCKVGGRIGNIHQTILNLPSDPVICNKSMCHCNYDIMSTKVL